LVDFKLKIGAFKPEYLRKMNFYLEALDREHKKNNENPSIGIILYASNEDQVFEFALSRSLSTVLYQSILLREKLYELNEMQILA
jgi:hypothetical protein